MTVETPYLRSKGASPLPRRGLLSQLATSPPVLQVTILVVILSLWEWVPAIPDADRFWPLLDHFFISSPSRIAVTLADLALGRNNMPLVWWPFAQSLVPAIVGTALAIAAGSAAGLICSNWDLLNRTVRPFVLVANALPRITLIPIFVIVAGPTSTASLMICFMVVFFLIFFSAFEGGRSVPAEMLENARILGAKPFERLRRLRLPYVMVWTFAQLPNAIAFGLTTSVTTELFTGANGLGRLLLIAVQTANADLTFAVAVILAVCGLALNGMASAVRTRVLHWW